MDVIETIQSQIDAIPNEPEVRVEKIKRDLQPLADQAKIDAERIEKFFREEIDPAVNRICEIQWRSVPSLISSHVEELNRLRHKPEELRAAIRELEKLQPKDIVLQMAPDIASEYAVNRITGSLHQRLKSGDGIESRAKQLLAEMNDYLERLTESGAMPREASISLATPERERAPLKVRKDFDPRQPTRT